MTAGKVYSVKDMNGLKIINLATPTNSGDAANKGYVDSVASGGATVSTSTIASTSPFVSGVTLSKIGRIVFPNGAISRASSFSTSYTPAGLITDPLFRPIADLELPVSVFRGGTFIPYQIQIIASTGVVNVRMNAANTLGMEMGGVSWIAP